MFVFPFSACTVISISFSFSSNSNTILSFIIVLLASSTSANTSISSSLSSTFSVYSYTSFSNPLISPSDVLKLFKYAFVHLSSSIFITYSFVTSVSSLVTLTLYIFVSFKSILLCFDTTAFASSGSTVIFLLKISIVSYGTSNEYVSSSIFVTSPKSLVILIIFALSFFALFTFIVYVLVIFLSLVTFISIELFPTLKLYSPFPLTTLVSISGSPVTVIVSVSYGTSTS